MAIVKIQSFLESWGLSTFDTSLYLQLCKLESSNVADMTKIMKRPRTSTERGLQRLVSDGLASKTKKGHESIYTVEEPKRLADNIEQRKAKHEESISGLDSLLDQFTKTLPLFEQLPKEQKHDGLLIRYYEGLPGFLNVTNRSLEYAHGEILQISDCKEWQKVFTKEYSESKYLPKRESKDISVKALVINNKEGRQFQKEGKAINREVRFLECTESIHGTILIYGNEVSIMISSKPYTAILLRSPMISSMFRLLFGQLWASSKE